MKVPRALGGATRLARSAIITRPASIDDAGQAGLGDRLDGARADRRHVDAEVLLRLGAFGEHAAPPAPLDPPRRPQVADPLAAWRRCLPPPRARRRARRRRPPPGRRRDAPMARAASQRAGAHRRGPPATAAARRGGPAPATRSGATSWAPTTRSPRSSRKLRSRRPSTVSSPPTMRLQDARQAAQRAEIDSRCRGNPGAWRPSRSATTSRAPCVRRRASRSRPIWPHLTMACGKAAMPLVGLALEADDQDTRGRRPWPRSRPGTEPRRRRRGSPSGRRRQPSRPTPAARHRLVVVGLVIAARAAAPADGRPMRAGSRRNRRPPERPETPRATAAMRSARGPRRRRTCR